MGTAGRCDQGDLRVRVRSAYEFIELALIELCDSHFERWRYHPTKVAIPAGWAAVMLEELRGGFTFFPSPWKLAFYTVRGAVLGRFP
jgi:hypothetical protein